MHSRPLTVRLEVCLPFTDAGPTLLRHDLGAPPSGVSCALLAPARLPHRLLARLTGSPSSRPSLVAYVPGSGTPDVVELRAYDHAGAPWYGTARCLVSVWVRR